MLSLVGRHRSCGNITVLPTSYFYPLKANERKQLFQDHRDSTWRRKFKHSYSVHFYGQITSGR